MSKKSEFSDDVELFRKAMKGVRRMDANEHVVSKPQPAPTPKQSIQDRDNVLSEMASGAIDFDDVEYGDEIVFRRPNVSRAMLRKLRRGQIAVQAELDLHGLSLDDAKSELSRFMRYCHEHGIGCVQIIHGKGHRSPGKLPVLKPQVAKWLSQWDDVVAFTSARAVDGGNGALYVLLKPR